MLVCFDVFCCADAAWRGETDKLLALLDAGRNVPVMIDVRDGQGRTPLAHAAAQGHTDAVRLLLEAGADVDLCGDDGRSALHWSAVYGHSEVVVTLAGAAASPDSEDASGCTPLDLAVASGCQFPNIRATRDGVDERTANTPGSRGRSRGGMGGLSGMSHGGTGTPVTPITAARAASKSSKAGAVTEAKTNVSGGAKKPIKQNVPAAAAKGRATTKAIRK